MNEPLFRGTSDLRHSNNSVNKACLAQEPRCRGSRHRVFGQHPLLQARRTDQTRLLLNRVGVRVSQPSLLPPSPGQNSHTWQQAQDFHTARAGKVAFSELFALGGFLPETWLLINTGAPPKVNCFTRNYHTGKSCSRGP